MTLQEIADRLARVALAEICAVPELLTLKVEDLGDWSHEVSTLTGRFRAELRPHLPKLKESKPSRFTRTCSLPGCDKLILTKNRSGVCTYCWHNRPDETAEVWASIATVMGINSVRMDRNMDEIGAEL